MNAKEYLYKPIWLNVVEKKDIDHEDQEESKLSLSIASGSVIFFPLASLSIRLAYVASRKEGWNWRNRTAAFIGAFISALITVLFVVLFFIPADVI